MLGNNPLNLMLGNNPLNLMLGNSVIQSSYRHMANIITCVGPYLKDREYFMPLFRETVDFGGCSSHFSSFSSARHALRASVSCSEAV